MRVTSNFGAPIEETTEADWERNFGVLAKGYFLPAREAFRVWRRQGIGGSLVFVVSKNAIAAGKKSTPEQRAKMLQALLAFDPMTEFGLASLGEMEKLSGWRKPDQAAYDKLKAALAEEEGVRIAREKREAAEAGKTGE